MREARKNHGLVVVNNKIYAIGGQGALGKKTNTHIKKDDSWSHIVKTVDVA